MSGIFEDHINKIIKNKSKSSTLTVRTGPTVKSSNFLLSARFFILDISEVLDQFCQKDNNKIIKINERKLVGHKLQSPIHNVVTMSKSMQMK